MISIHSFNGLDMTFGIILQLTDLKAAEPGFTA